MRMKHASFVLLGAQRETALAVNARHPGKLLCARIASTTLAQFVFFVSPTTLIFELTRNYVATSHKCHIKFVSLSHWATSHKCAPSQWGLRLRRSQHLRGRDAQPCGGDAS